MYIPQYMYCNCMMIILFVLGCTTLHHCRSLASHGGYATECGPQLLTMHICMYVRISYTVPEYVYVPVYVRLYTHIVLTYWENCVC